SPLSPDAPPARRSVGTEARLQCFCRESSRVSEVFAASDRRRCRKEAARRDGESGRTGRAVFRSEEAIKAAAADRRSRGSRQYYAVPCNLKVPLFLVSATVKTGYQDNHGKSRPRAMARQGCSASACIGREPAALLPGNCRVFA